MEFYAESQGNIVPADMAQFRKIRLVLSAMPDIIFDPNERGWDSCKNQMTCHLVCHALAEHFEVTAHDGHFVQSYQHSWLVPESKSSIIDAYPVAGASPFIVAGDRSSPWAKLYVPSDELRSKFDTRQYRDRLEQTVHAVAETGLRIGVF